MEEGCLVLLSASLFVQMAKFSLAGWRYLLMTDTGD